MHAVRGVDLTIDPGETLAIVGESGSGKSTLARLILRLIEPDQGSIEFDGVDLRTLSPRRLRSTRSQMTMVFQDPFSSFDPTMTVGDTVAEPLKLHGTEDAAARHRVVAELFRRVGLRTEHLGRYPRSFSGGQLQRIAIARALASNPRLIVCDEPVASLDVSIRGQVLNLLADLQDERGVAYLFISHDLSVVRQFAHRVGVMYSGRLVELGPAHEIYTNPKHPYTRALLAAAPTLHRSIRSETESRGQRAEENDTGGRDVGCPYIARCPMAMPICGQIDPALSPDAHAVACHLYPTPSAEALMAAKTPPTGVPQHHAPSSAIEPTRGRLPSATPE